MYGPRAERLTKAQTRVSAVKGSPPPSAAGLPVPGYPLLIPGSENKGNKGVRYFFRPILRWGRGTAWRDGVFAWLDSQAVFAEPSEIAA